jgi:hypothetical protein
MATDIDRARGSKRQIDQYGCGGRCWRDHYIYDMEKKEKIHDDDSDYADQRA